MTGIIYSATNLNNGKTYVGKSINSLETRKKNHLKCLKNPKTYFYKALRKYGSENFFWEIIEIINCEDREKLNRILNKYEIYYIKVMDTINSGYNGTHGGTGGLLSDEALKRMSESKKGNKSHLGFKNTKNTIEKMRNAKLGKKHTEEHNKKIGISSKGRLHTEEAKRKIGKSKEGNTYFLGKHHTEEAKRKMSEAKRKKI